MKVTIVGVGQFSQGLASLALRSGAAASFDLCLASRKLVAGSSSILPGLEAVPVCSLDDALPASDIVLLALPASALPSFVAAYGPQLADKVVVDVTNPSRHELQKLGLLSHTSTWDLTADMETSEEGKDPTAPGLAHGSMSLAGDKATGSHTSTAEWLSSVLPASSHVVKALCNLSAYALLHGDPLTEHMKSVAASGSSKAAGSVADFGRALGLEMRVVPSLAYASTLEARQHSLLATWQGPAAAMFITWLAVHIYSFLRYNYYGGTAWQHVTMWILNKSVGWVGLWGLAYTFLPGVLACYMQLVTRRPTMRLPRWMKAWMDARKQLGLLSFAAVLLHLLLSTFLWMPSYYQKLWDHTDTLIVPIINGTTLDMFGLAKATNKMPAGMQVVLGDGPVSYSSSNATILSAWPERSPNPSTATLVSAGHPTEVLAVVSNVITLRSKLNWIGESSTLLGILSGCLMGMIALTSMPSVIQPKLNWREWKLLQSHAGWLSVITATVHVILLGAPWWPKYKTDWPAMIPTITLLSVLPTMLLLVLKLVISLPPLSTLLSRVRNGSLARKDGGNKGGDPLAHTAVFAISNTHA